MFAHYTSLIPEKIDTAAMLKSKMQETGTNVKNQDYDQFNNWFKWKMTTDFGHANAIELKLTMK